MQEAQATVDGRTYPLPRPFLVVATQNPVEMEGTYPLPEAQRDRFMARLTVGLPEHRVRARHARPAGDVRPAGQPAPRHRRRAGQGRSSRPRAGCTPRPAVKRYVVDLVTATREDQGLRLGASPRAAIQLLRAAKALAAMDGRDHVLPDDVQQLGVPVLAHRLLPSTESRLSGRSTSDIVTDIVDRDPAPVRGGHGALASRDRLMRLRPTPRGWALGGRRPRGAAARRGARARSTSSASARSRCCSWSGRPSACGCSTRAAASTGSACSGTRPRTPCTRASEAQIEVRDHRDRPRRSRPAGRV